MRFQVLFHSPYWGTFHLSLTVLVHYRLLESNEPWRVVPPDSHGISRVPRYSGTKRPLYDGCADRAVTFFDRLFQDRSASRHKEARSLLPPYAPPYNPDVTTPTGYRITPV